jgi:ATP-dependent Clp protease protease subunit
LLKLILRKLCAAAAMAMSTACRVGAASSLRGLTGTTGNLQKARESSGLAGSVGRLPGAGFPKAVPKRRCSPRRQHFVSAAASSHENPFEAQMATGSEATLDWGGVHASYGGQQQQGSADPMTALLRQRVVFLGNQIDDFVADTIISQLLLLDANNPRKDIRLFINCSGGSLNAAMAIYDAVQLVRADVSTIALGIAASTAAIVLAGGTKGKRLAMPNTRIMIHQPLGGASGQAIDVEIQAKEIMYHKKNITRIMSQITGRPEYQVEEDTDRDNYMSPIEAMEYGIIDSVIDKEHIIPLRPMPEKVKPREIRLPLYLR